MTSPESLSEYLAKYDTPPAAYACRGIGKLFLLIDPIPYADHTGPVWVSTTVDENGICRNFRAITQSDLREIGTGNYHLAMQQFARAWINGDKAPLVAWWGLTESKNYLYITAEQVRAYADGKRIPYELT